MQQFFRSFAVAGERSGLTVDDSGPHVVVRNREYVSLVMKRVSTSVAHGAGGELES